MCLLEVMNEGGKVYLGLRERLLTQIEKQPCHLGGQLGANVATELVGHSMSAEFM